MNMNSDMQMRMPNGTLGNNMQPMMGDNKKNLMLLMKLRKKNNMGMQESGEASPEMMHRLMSEFKMMRGVM